MYLKRIKDVLCLYSEIFIIGSIREDCHRHFLLYFLYVESKTLRMSRDKLVPSPLKQLRYVL